MAIPFFKFAALALVTLVLGACSEAVPPTLEQTWSPKNPALANHFTFVTVGPVPSAKMKEVATTLATRRRGLLANQGVSDMPTVIVKVWGDRATFEAAYDGDNKSTVGGYIVKETWEARFFNFNRPLGPTAVHEVTHLVSVARNQTISNNPRWLWEAVAIYESARPPVPHLENLTCFSRDAGPTLSDLNTHPLNIYRVGYYLADFILKQWSRKGMLRLIDSNGNVEQALNVSTEQFERMWYEYMFDTQKVVPIETENAETC